MTSILSAKHSTARRPATSGDAPALPGQDVTLKSRTRCKVNGGRTVLLVILHYLLKNNITFMWGMEQGKTPPEGRPQVLIFQPPALTRGRLGGSVR